MRLRSSLAAGVAAVVTLAPAVAEAAARGDRPGGNGRSAALRPTCATAKADFPVATRITGGPATYEPGGGFRHWSVELTNTTGDTCENVHPVIVLVDGGKSLRPRQIQLEFDDGVRLRPVRFVRTERDENIGVFGGPQGSDPASGSRSASGSGSVSGPGPASGSGPASGADSTRGSGGPGKGGEADGAGAADAPGGDDFSGFTVGPGRTVTVRVRLAFTSDTAPDRVVASAAVVRRHADDGDWVGASGDYTFEIVEAAGPSGRAPGELAKTGPGYLPRLGGTAAALLGGVALVVGSRRLRARRR